MGCERVGSGEGGEGEEGAVINWGGKEGEKVMWEENESAKEKREMMITITCELTQFGMMDRDRIQLGLY